MTARTRLRAIAGLFAAAFLGLHLPFPVASLEDLGSINSALGARDFEVAWHQPHLGVKIFDCRLTPAF